MLYFHYLPTELKNNDFRLTNNNPTYLLGDVKMKYSNLNALINGSKSSRDFFLSLPVSMQMKLHEHSPYIHSAAELHNTVYIIQNARRLSDVSGFDISAKM